MIKKKMLMLIFALLLVTTIPFISADFGFDNVKNYDAANRKITITNGFGVIPFFDYTLAEYKLTYNTDQCLIDCYAEGEAHLYSKEQLFSNMEMYSVHGKVEREFKIYIEEEYESITKKEIYEEVCVTNKTTSCHQEFTGEYKEIKTTKTRWKEYNGEELEGFVRWRLEGKKKPTEKLDWRGSAFSQTFLEWAWWNVSWNYRRKLTFTNTLGQNRSHGWSGIISELKVSNCTNEIRITDSSDVEIPSFSRTVNTTACEVFFKLDIDDSEATKDFYIYYNSSASAPSYTTNMTIANLTAIYNRGYNITTMRGSFGSEHSQNWGLNDINAYNFNGNNTFATGGTGRSFQMQSTNDATTWTRVANVINNPVVAIYKVNGSNAGDTYNITFFHDVPYWKYDGINTGDGNGGIRTRFYWGQSDFHNVYRTGNGTYGDILGGDWATDPDTMDFAGYFAHRRSTDTKELFFFYKNETGQSIGTTYQYTAYMRDGDPADPQGSFPSSNYEDPDGSTIDGDTIYIGFLDNADESGINESREDLFLSLWFPVTYVKGSEETSTTAVSVTLNSPPNAMETAGSNVTFNCSATAKVVNMTLIIDGADNYTIYNTTANQNMSLEIAYNLSDGEYNYTCEAWNIDGNNDTASAYTFTVDTTEPKLSLSSPNKTYHYGVNLRNLTLNWTVNDSVIGLHKCRYVYNETNYTVTCGNNGTIFTVERNYSSLRFYANDTLGNLNNQNISWNFLIWYINQSYSAAVQEGATTSFTTYLDLMNGYTPIVYLNYNNTQYLATQTGSLNDTRFNRNVTVPTISANTNFTFFWNISMTNSSTTTYIITNSTNQSVQVIALDNCSSYSNKLLEFNVVDEEFQGDLNGTELDFETAINIYTKDRTIKILNFSANYSYNPLMFCLNVNVTGDTEYSLDTIVRYQGLGYANEYYNIVNYSLTNTSDTQNITLYDLNSSDSTDFQLTFTGSDFLPVEAALVYVDRQYISENLFKTVELPLTDSNGQTILHLVRNDVIYNIRILKNGTVLGNFENIVAFCEDYTIGDCKITLNAFDSTAAIFDYDTSLGITFNYPTYNETSRVVSFTFVSSDGSAKNVTLNVTKTDIFGNRTVCNDNVLSSSGTLTCTVPAAIDEAYLRIRVSVDEDEVVLDTLKMDKSNYGQIGFFFFFIMLISFVFLFSSSKNGVIAGLILGLGAGVGLGLTSGSIIGVGASGIWIIIVLIIAIWKINKERIQ